MITLYIRDSKTLEIPLAWESSPFVAGTAWALIFTAKHDADDEDAAAAFQKASGAGITTSGSNAFVAIVPDDTDGLESSTLYCDVRAQHADDGRRRTVWQGRIRLIKDITRETTTSIPVHTTGSPLPFGPSVSVTAGDELEIVSGETTYYVPLYRRP